jgi:hypothetical protein
MTTRAATVCAIPGIVSFWDFQEATNDGRYISLGRERYALHLGGGQIRHVEAEGAPFGSRAIEIDRGGYLAIQRADCPALDIHGPGAQVSVVAWIQRHRKTEIECEAIAGLWDETRRKRQYALFLDLRIHNAHDNVGGHISSVGGPTAGFPWCMDAAIGAGYVEYFHWQNVAFTYDGAVIRAFRNGRLESRPGFNPYAYPDGIFDGGSDGADFTVGAVHRGGEMGNWFVGRLGGLAIFNRALSETELASCQS